MTLTCTCCEKKFEFTDGEISFYLSKGFTYPRKCKECRKYGGYRPGLKNNSFFDITKNSIGRSDVSAYRDINGHTDNFYAW